MRSKGIDVFLPVSSAEAPNIPARLALKAVTGIVPPAGAYRTTSVFVNWPIAAILN
jgi:hypothetical protein